MEIIYLFLQILPPAILVIWLVNVKHKNKELIERNDNLSDELEHWKEEAKEAAKMFKQYNELVKKDKKIFSK